MAVPCARWFAIAVHDPPLCPLSIPAKHNQVFVCLGSHMMRLSFILRPARRSSPSSPRFVATSLKSCHSHVPPAPTPFLILFHVLCYVICLGSFVPETFFHDFLFLALSFALDFSYLFQRADSLLPPSAAHTLSIQPPTFSNDRDWPFILQPLRDCGSKTGALFRISNNLTASFTVQFGHSLPNGNTG